MTYKEYIAACQRKQRAYIKGERLKYRKAKVLCEKYETGMRALNLQVLNGLEIYQRLQQLDRMERDVPETHGDSVAMQAAYEWHGKDALP